MEIQTHRIFFSDNVQVYLEFDSGMKPERFIFRSISEKKKKRDIDYDRYGEMAFFI